MVLNDHGFSRRSVLGAFVAAAVAEANVAIQSVGGTNSVAVHGDVVAAAIEADPATDDGTIAFYDASSFDLIDAVSVGPLPDKVTFSPDGTYVVVANEGDAKDFEVGVLKNLDLDPAGFDLSENPYVDSVEELTRPENLGNMEVNEASMAEFAVGSDGYTDIYAVGDRSFSVWNASGEGTDLVYDSGNDFERTFAEQYPEGHVNVVEGGPETESAELGVVGDRTFAFVGQEVGSGIAAYDVTAPGSPDYTQMIVNRDYSVSEDDLAAAAAENPDGDEPARAGDFAPEGVHFVPATESPIRNPLLRVGFEISGTVGVFEVTPVTDA